MRFCALLTALWFGLAMWNPLAYATDRGDDGPALGDPRITQADLTSGHLSLKEIRAHGRHVFARPFNVHDGLGDGPKDPNEPDTVSPGGRPTLQGNGMFLRMNGLDSQTCAECHSVASMADFPMRFAIGGAGGAAASAMPGVISPDAADQLGNGFAETSGRFINPPFVFGSGGVELVGKEMTAELQALRVQAFATPGVSVALIAKGVNFGSLVCDTGSCDASDVIGIEPDLVVRPFGRKGQFFSTRDFAKGAMMFHHGMQPVEVVGKGIDADRDGVANEVLVGEMSALHIFMATLEKPRRRRVRGIARQGEALFASIGCASCHIPELETESRHLKMSHPEDPTDPQANAYTFVDLAARATRFKRSPGGGVIVALFSDLKRHDMGEKLAESTGSPLDAQFITARLWGIADTAPYLHDGRASTLTEAILLHGGEAENAAEAFDALTDEGEAALISFLRTLRTPRDPNRDLRRFDHIFNR